MAKANSKAAAMLLNLAVMLSLLLLITVAEGRLINFGFAKVKAPSCDSVYGVATGDTCFAVQQNFNLTDAEFASINPNLVCNKLFVGQWLCVSGSA